MDWGLLGGIGQGIQSGVQSFETTRKNKLAEQMQQNEQALKQKQYDAGLYEKGLYENKNFNKPTEESSGLLQAGLIKPEEQKMDTREFLYTPEKASQIKRDADFIDSNSEISKNARESTKEQLLASGNAKLASSIKDNMSAKDVQESVKEGLIGNIIKGQFQEKAGQNRINLGNDRLDNLKQQQALQHANEVKNDKVIMGIKVQDNALNRGEKLLNGKTPITANTLNAIQQDFINGLSQGGAATEGKINRELIENFQTKWNEIKTKAGKMRDVRKEAPELVENLRALMRDVRKEYAQARADRFSEITRPYAASKNEYLKQALDDMAPDYAAPKEEVAPQEPSYSEPAGPVSIKEHNDALLWAQKNPNDPKAKLILQLQGK